VQLVGGVACGPNTLKVIVPVAVLVAPDSVELTAEDAIAVPETSVEGPAAVTALAFVMTVEAIPLPHVLAEATLLESPL
jgi:hypothetical protein